MSLSWYRKEGIYLTDSSILQVLKRHSLLKQIQVSSAWTPCAVSQKERQRAHLLEECWNELQEDVVPPPSADHGVPWILSIPTTGASWLSPLWTHLPVKGSVALCGSHFTCQAKIQYWPSCEWPHLLWNLLLKLQVVHPHTELKWQTNKTLTWIPRIPPWPSTCHSVWINRQFLSLSGFVPCAWGTPNGISGCCWGHFILISRKWKKITCVFFSVSLIIGYLNLLL